MPLFFPELTLTGYPPEDFVNAGRVYTVPLSVHWLIFKTQVTGIDIVIGYPQQTDKGLFNAAGVLRDGKIVAVHHKCHLPNYGVF